MTALQFRQKALEGKGARSDEVIWGAAFNPVFRYGGVPNEALGVVKGKRLDSLLRSQGDLRVDIVPEGSTLTDDVAGRIAHFEDGKMIGEPPRPVPKMERRRTFCHERACLRDNYALRLSQPGAMLRAV